MTSTVDLLHTDTIGLEASFLPCAAVPSVSLRVTEEKLHVNYTIAGIAAGHEEENYTIAGMQMCTLLVKMHLLRQSQGNLP